MVFFKVSIIDYILKSKGILDIIKRCFDRSAKFFDLFLSNSTLDFSSKVLFVMVFKNSSAKTPLLNLKK